jgi:hypothetical protein
MPLNINGQYNWPIMDKMDSESVAIGSRWLDATAGECSCLRLVKLNKNHREPLRYEYWFTQRQIYVSVNLHALLIVRSNNLRMCVHTCTYELGLVFRNLNICK